MITCIRELRRAKGMTLAEVAAACTPPTTAQTIGRLETGTRTVSVGWLNRIAAALGATAADLVRLPDQVDLPVAALLRRSGAVAPQRPLTVVPPQPEAGALAVTVEESVGDYRAGDSLWCQRLAPGEFAQALNRDVLAPRRAGHFLFGRLIRIEGPQLLILPPAPGARQAVLTDVPWIAAATRLVRTL